MNKRLKLNMQRALNKLQQQIKRGEIKDAQVREQQIRRAYGGGNDDGDDKRSHSDGDAGGN